MIANRYLKFLELSQPHRRFDTISRNTSRRSIPPRYVGTRWDGIET